MLKAAATTGKSIVVGTLFFATLGMAEGALAVAVPADVATAGFSFGFSAGVTAGAAARERALNSCRTNNNGGSDETKALCKIVDNFRNKCVAVSMDPKFGTPGVGRAIAKNRHEAEQQALAHRKPTAGDDRISFCEITSFGCDGTAAAKK